MNSISAFISAPNLFFLCSKVHSKKTLHEILTSHIHCKNVALCGMNTSFQNFSWFLIIVISYRKIDLGNKKEEEEMIMNNYFKALDMLFV
jgi:hypothetical protein